LILLLSAALFGFAACEGSFVDPGALEYEAVTGGEGGTGGGGLGGVGPGVGDQLNGTTWTESGVTLKFNRPNFTMTMSVLTIMQGTYSVSGSTVTLTKDSGEKLNGTLSGNKLTIGEMEFTKQ